MEQSGPVLMGRRGPEHPPTGAAIRCAFPIQMLQHIVIEATLQCLQSFARDSKRAGFSIANDYHVSPAVDLLTNATAPSAHACFERCWNNHGSNANAPPI